MEEKNPSQMREGFTTGACAAAAAKAAARLLLSKKTFGEIETTLPIGKKVFFALKRCELYNDFAICSVIKDAGDDPDCTNGAELTAKVSLNKSGKIHIYGGEGVATVTKEGLGLEVGTSAINPVPRKNITEMVLEELEDSAYGADVEISVPGGIEMAKETLNARLGLIGGISILGTTGIVRPYSTAAFRASVVQAIDMSIKNKHEILVFTTGGKSEQYAMELFPTLNELSFIQVGDFIGTGLKRAAVKEAKLIIIVGMIGKLSKMAEGKMMTHAAGSKVNMEMLADIAREIGADENIQKEILASVTARGVLEICEKNGFQNITQKICERVVNHCSSHIQHKVPINCYLLGFAGEYMGDFEAMKRVDINSGKIEDNNDK